MAKTELISNIPPFQAEVGENPKSENLEISSLCIFCVFVTPYMESACEIKCVLSHMLARLSLIQAVEEMEIMTSLPF